MIAFHFNDEALKTAASQNQSGTWVFIVDDVNGVLPQQQGKEKMFYATGTWEEARAKAETCARTSYGCKDGVDSILVVNGLR